MPQALVVSNTYRKSVIGASGDAADVFKRIKYEFKISSNSNAGAMNMETGVFTAPINGTYMFTTAPGKKVLSIKHCFSDS